MPELYERIYWNVYYQPTGAGEAFGEEAIENCPNCDCEDVYYIFQAGNRVKIPDDND